jgi:hypothetical protein
MPQFSHPELGGPGQWRHDDDRRDVQRRAEDQGEAALCRAGQPFERAISANQVLYSSVDIPAATYFTFASAPQLFGQQRGKARLPVAHGFVGELETAYVS